MSKLPIGSKVCQCAACGEYFTVPSAFDKHRSGPWSARICLNPAEIGLVKGANGRWGYPTKGRVWLSNSTPIEH